jgi:hypothetical protein
MRDATCDDMYDDMDSHWSTSTCSEWCLPRNRPDEAKPDLRLVESFLELASLSLRILSVVDVLFLL